MCAETIKVCRAGRVRRNSGPAGLGVLQRVERAVERGGGAAQLAPGPVVTITPNRPRTWNARVITELPDHRVPDE